MSKRTAHNFKWDECSIRKVASQYDQVKEFRKAFPGAYSVANRLKIIDELFPNTCRRKWSLEELKNEALKYTRRSDFQRHSAGAYSAAIKKYPELLDEIYGEYFKWKEVDLKYAISKYKSKGELQKASGNLYSITLRRFPHLLDECFVPKRYKWTEDSIIDAIELCKSRSQFLQQFPGAYRAIERSFQHLRNLLPPPIIDGTDNDAVYIWRAVGQYYKGNAVYKIGITSSKLGISRIKGVSKVSGFEYDVVCCEAVTCSAMKLEKKLHLLGEDPQYSGFNGSSEFRALSDSALYVAISLISEYSKE